MRRGDWFAARVLDGEVGTAVDPFLSLDHFRRSLPTFPPHPHAGTFEISGAASGLEVDVSGGR